MLSENKEAFLSLVRLGIGHRADVLPEFVDWNALEDLAARQGLSAVVVDGVGKLPEDMRPPKSVLLQWIGETLQGYEYRYGQYCKAIAEMASFYNKHAFQLMANELGMEHTVVSAIYTVLQLAISVVMLLIPNTPAWHWGYFICICILLACGYLLFMRKYYHLHEEYLESLESRDG